MTEEVKKEETPAPEEKAPEYSAVELRAMEMGWRPKEEWDGDESEFVDAKEFVGRQPLYDKIQTQGKALKETQRALEAFKNHYTKVRETEYKRAKEALEAERDRAIDDADSVTARKISKQIDEIEAEAAEIRKAHETPLIQEQPAENPVFTAWKNKNAWYTTTSYMKAYADQVGMNLARQGMEPQEVLKEVEKAVRKEFPHKFTNPNKASAPNVDSSRGKGSSTKSVEDDLSDTERQIMNTLVRGGHITKEKYLADLVEAKKQRK